MSKFKEFKEAFNEKYKSIYYFIESTEAARPVIPFNGKLIENSDETEYDSYGAASTTLRRIFYFEDYDLNVLFEGYSSSYDGEEWNEMKEVKQIEKTITVWE